MTPLAIALGIGLAWTLGNGQVRNFERLAAEDLKSRLTGPAIVDVKTHPNGPIAGAWGELLEAKITASHFSTIGLPLFTEPERSKKGILKLLTLDLSDFELSGLHVERLHASIPDCRYDFAHALKSHKIRLSRSGEGTGYVAIREKDLEGFILRKFREIKSVSVQVAKDHVFVEGYGEFLIAKTRFFVVASLEPLDGTKLVLTNARILLDGQRAEGPAHKALLDMLNPVVDLDKDLKLYGAVFVDRLRLRDGLLEAWGRTRIPNQPGQSSLLSANPPHFPMQKSWKMRSTMSAVAVSPVIWPSD